LPDPLICRCWLGRLFRGRRRCRRLSRRPHDEIKAGKDE
jgi:hypothetical protein